MQIQSPGRRGHTGPPWVELSACVNLLFTVRAGIAKAVLEGFFRRDSKCSALILNSLLSIILLQPRYGIDAKRSQKLDKVTHLHQKDNSFPVRQEDGRCHHYLTMLGIPQEGEDDVITTSLSGFFAPEAVSWKQLMAVPLSPWVILPKIPNRLQTCAYYQTLHELSSTYRYQWQMFTILLKIVTLQVSFDIRDLSAITTVLWAIFSVK